MDKDDRSLVAIIPVRKGSQRIPYKNLKKFSDTNLLEIKINQLKNIKDIDEIIVNSDWEEALELAKKLGVSTYKRDSYYASSTVSANDFYKNLAENSPDKYKYIMYAPPTSPLISNNTINNIIDEFFKDTTYDSIVTTSIKKNFLWENNKPINYDIFNTPRSQDLPDIHAINYGIVINTREYWLNKKSLIGNNPKLYSISDFEAIDIDNPIDFEIAEILYDRYLKTEIFKCIDF